MSDIPNSMPITWAEAQLMHTAYMANPAALKTTTPAGTFTTLQGLQVDSQALLNIINGHDPEGNPVQDPCPQIMLLLGVRSEDLNKPASQQCFTTILVGVNAQNVVQKEVVYDYSKPCPPSCPIY